MADRVFLSYAREDDEAFAARLYEDLVSQQFDVWWDRRTMPSRGRTFLQELSDGIADADRLLVVLGPKAIKSPYVRMEWEQGLIFCKAVIPLLRLDTTESSFPSSRDAGYDLVPTELASYHCVDFRGTREYQDAWTELLRILRQPLESAGAHLSSIPALPPHFLLRPNEIAAVERLMLAHTLEPLAHQIVSTFCGIGGVGKTTLASAVARSAKVLRAFPDGVVWATVGQEPNALSIVRLVASAFDEDLSRYTALEEARNRLPAVLKGKRSLLIFDDVWDASDVELFLNAAGPRCRVLITTRERNLASVSTGNQHELEVLSRDDAISLLCNWVGLTPAEAPLALKDVATHCGYLPLALSMCGAMARSKIPWNELLDALRSADVRSITARLTNYPHRDLFRAMQVSVTALDNADAIPELALGRLYRELAVFPKEDIPEGAVLTLWCRNQEVSPRHARWTLGLLHNRNLLRIDEPRSGPIIGRYIRLHDLQVDYLVAISQDIAKQHQTLLAAYRASIPADVDSEGHWSMVPNDGYIHTHLVRHLVAAQRDWELETLFADDRWLHAHLRVGAGGLLSYSRDLNESWNVAERKLHADLSIGSCFRHALIQTSLNAAVAQYPPKLVARAVEIDEWSLERALAVAELSTDMVAAEIAVRLLSLTDVPQDARSRILKAGIQRARQIRHQVIRSRLLLELGSAGLNGEETELFEEAYAALGETERRGFDWEAVDVLMKLSLKVPPERMVVFQTEALAIALRGRGTDEAIWCFEGVIDNAGQPQLDAALEAFLDLHKRCREDITYVYEKYWCKAMARLVAKTPSQYFDAVVGAVELGKYKAGGVSVVISVADRVPSELRRMLVDKAEALAYGEPMPGARDHAIAQVFPYLDRNRQRRALRQVREFIQPDWIVQVAQHCTADEREELLDLALQVTRRFSGNYTADNFIRIAAVSSPDRSQLVWEEALSCLAKTAPRFQLRALTDADALIPLEYRQEVIERAVAALDDALADPEWRYESALNIILPWVTPSQLRSLIKAFSRVRDDIEVSHWLSCLIPRANESWRTKLLDSVRAFRTPAAQGQLLTVLSSHSFGSVLERVLSTVDVIEDEGTRLDVLRDIVADLTPELRDGCVRRLIAEALQYNIEPALVKALEAAAPFVSSETLSDYLWAAEAIPSIGFRARVIASLPIPPPSDMKNRSIADLCDGISSVASNEVRPIIKAITSWCDEPERDSWFRRVRQVVLSMKDVSRRANATATIAGYFDHDATGLIQEALSDVEQLPAGDRAAAMIELAISTPPRLFRDDIAAATHSVLPGIEELASGGELLLELASKHVEFRRVDTLRDAIAISSGWKFSSKFRSQLIAALTLLSEDERRTVLEHIRNTVFGSLSAEAAIEFLSEAAPALGDATRDWLREEAIVLARLAENDESRVAMFGNLRPWMPVHDLRTLTRDWIVTRSAGGDVARGQTDSVYQLGLEHTVQSFLVSKEQWVTEISALLRSYQVATRETLLCILRSNVLPNCDLTDEEVTTLIVDTLDLHQCWRWGS